MANLRELRSRLASIKSTRKITSAMKMVAASRLRQAQEALSESGYFTASLGRIILRLEKTVEYLRLREPPETKESAYVIPHILIGTGDEKKHLVIAFSSSRGLCGGFNANVAKKTVQFIKYLEENGASVKIICVGAKIRDALKNRHGDKIIGFYHGSTDQAGQRADAEKISMQAVDLHDSGTIDACSLIFNKFSSAISQEVVIAPLIPVEPIHLLKPFAGDPWGFQDDSEAFHIERQKREIHNVSKSAGTGIGNSSPKRPSMPAFSAGKDKYVAGRVSSFLESDAGDSKAKDPLEYDFEPENPAALLEALIPELLSTLVYRATLDSVASENGARMTAMDNATNNAADIIDSLTLLCNRKRQAMITSELSEIISGAEAL